MSTGQAFPNTSAPFVDQTGRIQQPWLQIIISLWNRTGGAGGNTIIDLVLQQTMATGPASANAADQLQLQTLLGAPTPGPAPEEIEALLFALALRRVTTSAGLGLGVHNTPTFAGLTGVSDGSAAAAGTIGEYISSTRAPGSAIGLTTNVTADITSISLTAGDWDIWGNVEALPDAGVSLTNVATALSTTTATLPLSPNNGGYGVLVVPFTVGQPCALPAGQMRLSLIATTTVYLVTQVGFGGGACAGYGFIGARRRR